MTEINGKDEIFSCNYLISDKFGTEGLSGVIGLVNFFNTSLNEGALIVLRLSEESLVRFDFMNTCDCYFLGPWDNV